MTLSLVPDAAEALAYVAATGRPLPPCWRILQDLRAPGDQSSPDLAHDASMTWNDDGAATACARTTRTAGNIRCPATARCATRIENDRKTRIKRRSNARLTAV
jgi:hypothetical protein